MQAERETGKCENATRPSDRGSRRQWSEAENRECKERRGEAGVDDRNRKCMNGGERKGEVCERVRKREKALKVVPT